MKNSQAHFNTFAEPGPLTSSDHIPIIYKISTSPTLSNIIARLNYTEKQTGASTEIFYQNTPTLTLATPPLMILIRLPQTGPPKFKKQALSQSQQQHSELSLI